MFKARDLVTLVSVSVCVVSVSPNPILCWFTARISCLSLPRVSCVIINICLKSPLYSLTYCRLITYILQFLDGFLIQDPPFFLSRKSYLGLFCATSSQFPFHLRSFSCHWSDNSFAFLDSLFIGLYSLPLSLFFLEFPWFVPHFLLQLPQSSYICSFF